MATNLPKPDQRQRSNFAHLYWDVVWYGVLAGSTLAFVAIYAARLNANSFQLGLLSALPAVVNMIFSLPSGHWLENKPLVRATFWTSIAQRLGYLLLVPLPWLFGNSAQIWAILLVTLVMSLPGTVLAISFNALFADAVAPEWRGIVVGRRNALIALSITLTTLICGLILDKWHNYQLVFLIGGLGALLSSYHLFRLLLPSELPMRVGAPLGDLAFPGIMRLFQSVRPAVGLRFLTRAPGKSLLRLDLVRSSFGLLMAAYLVFYIFQNIPLPLFPLYLVKNLHLTDGTISLGNGLFYSSMMIASLYLSKISNRLGHKGVLLLGSLLFGIYPLVLYLAHNELLYWVASVEGGVVWAILNGGLVNRLMERVPEDDRPGHMALHNLVLNFGILIGSMLAPVLVKLIGISDALLVGAALRMAATGFLWAWG